MDSKQTFFYMHFTFATSNNHDVHTLMSINQRTIEILIIAIVDALARKADYGHILTSTMDTTKQSLITPTTCFTVACVAFSVLAISSVWKNHQQSTSRSKRKSHNGALEQPLQLRPKAIRRRAVDSLYVPPGELDFSQFETKDESDDKNEKPAEALSELITLCASLAQQLRSYQPQSKSRFTFASLLGELSLLTTNLCRLQQHLVSNPLWLSQGSGLVACFDTTVFGLRESFLFLQAGLTTPSAGQEEVIRVVLQQLRDQRPSLGFLLEQASSTQLPPTPPCDSDFDSSLRVAKASGSSLFPPPQPSTGLTPIIDAKGWIEPPPEYSPPSSSSIVVLQPEKGDVKAAIPLPPEENGESEPSSQASDEDDRLYDVITDDDIDLVTNLVSSGADPNKPTGDLSRTPLHHAAHLNHAHIVPILLKHGAITNIQDRSGDTPLHLAAWAGNVEALSAILSHSQNAEIDYLSGRDAYSPLWCAISASHIDAARLLLKHGARVSLRSSSSGMMVLHQAAVTGQSAMCELLLEKGGANVDAVDEDGQTALHYAAATGSVGCVRVLLQAGAGVDVKQSLGLTPAHWAAHKGHCEVLGLLMEFGAKVGSVANEGATALHLAANRGHLSAAKLLLEKGARKNGRAAWDGVEGTPTEMAKSKGHARVARFIQSWQRPK